MRHYSGPVAQWTTRLPTEQKIPGSTPGRFVETLVTFTDLTKLVCAHSYHSRSIFRNL